MVKGGVMSVTSLFERAEVIKDLENNPQQSESLPADPDL